MVAHCDIQSPRPPNGSQPWAWYLVWPKLSISQDRLVETVHFFCMYFSPSSHGLRTIILCSILIIRHWYYLLAPKELYTWYCTMTIQHPPFEHTLWVLMPWWLCWMWFLWRLRSLLISHELSNDMKCQMTISVDDFWWQILRWWHDDTWYMMIKYTVEHY